MKKMVQLSCLTASFLLLAFGLWQSPSAVRASQKPAAGTQYIDAFDDCIQERFKDIDKRFGLARVITVGNSPHRFKPENAREMATLKEFNDRKLEVALYLGSRSLFGDKPEEKEWEPRAVRTDLGVTSTSIGTGIGFSRRIIKGPVLISAKDKNDLPLSADLWAQSKTAMQAFATRDSFEFTFGNWKFIARPVRANEQSCLQCHVVDTRAIRTHKASEVLKPLKIGDPLGIVLYAYREAK
jgi:hypothetical protein